MLAPGLTVEGVGPVALPLLPAQAEHLIAAAERAPYGRGEDTLTDISVRAAVHPRDRRLGHRRSGRGRPDRGGAPQTPGLRPR
jgi:hypothetical protein